jgi:hypothetical protein
MDQQAPQHFFQELMAVAAGALHHGVHGSVFDIDAFAFEAVAF